MTNKAIIIRLLWYHQSYIDICRAELSSGNLKPYSHFLSLCIIKIAQVVEIIVSGSQGCIYPV